MAIRTDKGRKIIQKGRLPGQPAHDAFEQNYGQGLGLKYRQIGNWAQPFYNAEVN